MLRADWFPGVKGAWAPCRGHGDCDPLPYSLLHSPPSVLPHLSCRRENAPKTDSRRREAQGARFASHSLPRVRVGCQCHSVLRISLLRHYLARQERDQVLFRGMIISTNVMFKKKKLTSQQPHSSFKNMYTYLTPEHKISTISESRCILGESSEIS